MVNRGPDLDTWSPSNYPDNGSARHDWPARSELYFYGCGGRYKCGLVMGFGAGKPSKPFASSFRIEDADCNVTDQPVRVARPARASPTVSHRLNARSSPVGRDRS